MPKYGALSSKYHDYLEKSKMKPEKYRGKVELYSKYAELDKLQKMRLEYIEKHMMALDELDELILAANAQLKENGKVDEVWARTRMDEIDIFSKI